MLTRNRISQNAKPPSGNSNRQSQELKRGIEQQVADVKAELIRRQRELDDAKREMNLTIETKVQESLASVRQKARQEAEDALKVKLVEKDEWIASMQRQRGRAATDCSRGGQEGSTLFCH